MCEPRVPMSHPDLISGSLPMGNACARHDPGKPMPSAFWMCPGEILHHNKNSKAMQ